MSHGFEIMGFSTVEEAWDAYDRDDWATAPEVDIPQAKALIGAAVGQDPTSFCELDWGCLAAELSLEERHGRVIGISAMVYYQCETMDEAIRLVVMLGEMADRLGFWLLDTAMSRTYEPGQPGKFLGIDE